MFELARRLPALSVLLFGLNAHAQVKTTIERINGFEVHLVDTGRGDSFGIGFLVPFGALQDFGRDMGRAHFLEHFLHNGTRTFPGYHTFEEVNKPLGVNTNAFTALDKTYYYISAKMVHAPKIIPMYLSMLGGLEWNKDTYSKQILAVINEIATERLPMEGDAMDLMPFTHLLAPGHPWSLSPAYGDAGNLAAMSMDDMKDLYYRNYSPEFVKVAVMGNFTDPAAASQIRELLQKHLRPADYQQDPDKFIPRGPGTARDPVPSLFANPHEPSESRTRLIVQSDSMKAGRIFMESEMRLTNESSAIGGLVTTYMGLELPGTFMHTLKTKLGWVTRANISTTSFANRTFLDFSYEMTDEGLKNQKQLEALFFTALADLHWNGIPPETLAAMKSSTVVHMNRISRNVSQLLDSYHGILGDSGSTEAQLEVLKHVKDSGIRGWAAHFYPDRALYSTVQPSAEGMTADTRFQRKFKIIDHSADVAGYLKIHPGDKPPKQTFPANLVPLDLGALDANHQPSFFTQTRPKPFLPVRLTLDFRKDLPDTALSMRLKLNPDRAADLAVLDIVLEAFAERHAAELLTLNLKYGVRVSVERKLNVLQSFATGEDRYAARALTWIFNQLANFVPTTAEVERARANLQQGLQSKYLGDFTAMTTLDIVRSSLDPLRLSTLDTRQAVLQATVKQVQDWRGIVAKAQKELVMTGDLKDTDGVEIHRAVLKLSPHFLGLEPDQALSGRGIWKTGTEHMKFPAERNGSGQGMARIYQGPELLNTKEMAAFQALSSLLATKIFIHNREEAGLGYVHSARTFASDGRRALLFLFGQTENSANTRLAIQGWNDILANLASGAIQDEEISNAIQDLVSGLSAQKTTAEEIAADYDAGQSSRFDARASRDMLNAMAKLTPADVRAIAQKYILDPNVEYRQLTISDCESLL